MKKHPLKDPPGKILIVDDESVIRNALEALLFVEGYEFAHAANGYDALDQVEIFNPDVILLDIMMPGLDGYETCRLIKADPRWKSISIILVSALDSKEDLVTGLDSGADEFLNKPVSSLELKARVRTMMRIKRQYDQLNQLLQVREDLTNMIIHDLRTPLSLIEGEAEHILQSAGLPDTLAPHMKRIRTHAQRLNTSLTDLILIAKMEQSAIAVHLASTDLAIVAQKNIERFQPLASSRHIHLVSEIPPDPCLLLIDPDLIERMIDNLITNAIKYTPAEGTVALRLMPEPHQPNQVLIQVFDEGPGIPEADRKEIFEKYHIVQLRQKGLTQVGLGLAFCKLVVQAHNGQIWVEDNHGSGSIFNVLLPQALALEEPAIA